MTVTVYFITGTTGFLGGEILRTVLAQDSNAQCYCLVRDASQKKLVVDSDRVFPVVGDITLNHFGLNDDEYQALAKKITHIIHSAAVVQFEKPKAFLESVNVQGARNVIEFAKACQQHNPDFKVLGHISTAYVAGQRLGKVKEQDFSAAHGFKNNYEASKFASEQLMHEAKKNLPVIIFRPSIILGHSETGYSLKSNVLFPTVQIIKKTPFSILPLASNKNALLDLVPVDYVAKGVYFLMRTPSAIGQTFHLTSGIGNEVSMKKMSQIYSQMYGIRFFFIPSFLWHLIRPILSLSKKGQYFAKGIGPFWVYCIANPQYCNEETQKFLDLHAINCNPMEDVLKKTLLFMQK